MTIQNVKNSPASSHLIRPQYWPSNPEIEFETIISKRPRHRVELSKVSFCRVVVAIVFFPWSGCCFPSFFWVVRLPLDISSPLGGTAFSFSPFGWCCVLHLPSFVWVVLLGLLLFQGGAVFLSSFSVVLPSSASLGWCCQSRSNKNEMYF